jgi:hypothetical protein
MMIEVKFGVRFLNFSRGWVKESGIPRVKAGASTPPVHKIRGHMLTNAWELLKNG